MSVSMTARRATCIANDTEPRSHNPSVDRRTGPSARLRAGQADSAYAMSAAVDADVGRGDDDDNDVDEEGALSSNASCGKR